MEDYEIESVVRGHHVYKAIWSPETGEVLQVLPENNNEYDLHAVSVLKNGSIVGHVPRELSKIIKFFLATSGSSVTCHIAGRRKKGLGLEVPCIYTAKGKSRYIKRLKKVLSKV